MSRVLGALEPGALKSSVVKFGALVGIAAFALSACQSVDEAAIDASPLRCPEGSDCFDPNVPIGPGSAMTVEAREWTFNLADGVAVDGPVEVTLQNTGGTTHNFRIDEAVGDVKKVQAEAGAENTDTLLLFAGTYTFYCDIPGHRAQGMEGTITVYNEGEAPEDGSEGFETVGG